MKATDKIAESEEVSVRLRAFCKTAKIETFADLLAIPKQNLLKFRNFGRRCNAEVEEIRETLKTT